MKLKKQHSKPMVEVPSILIVDDDEGMRQSLALALKKKGYQPATAGTGVAALALTQDRSFNIALVDVRLPDMEGTELLSRLKETHPDLQVMLITAYASLKSAILALAKGAYYYFTKPLDMNEVVAVVKDALEKQRLAIENRMLYQAAQRELAERKRAEEALQESKEFIETIFNSVNDCLCVINTSNFRIVAANRAFLDNYMGQEDPIGRRCYEVTHRRSEPCEPPHDVCPLQETLRTGSHSSAEHIHYDKLGRERYFEVLTSPIREEKGEIDQVVHISHDITERKRAGQALRESEERYRAIIEQSADAIYLVDVETKRLLQTNTAFQKMLGYSPEELVGISLYDFIVADPEDIDQRIQRIRMERQIPLFERLFRRKDGSLLPVWVSGFVVSYGGREVVCGTARDLTAHKQAAEALRQSEERYRAIMEQSADGIFLIDVETRRIMEANPAFQRMLGYSAEGIKGLSIYDFVMSERIDIDRRFQEILAGKGGIFFERQYRRQDGSSVDVWISGKLISFAGRAAVAILARDLTEKRVLEAHLLRAQRMESIGLLAGGIAHDLNNVLTPILIHAELLDRSLSDPNSQKMLSSIASNAQRGADIVRQILAFARGMEGEHLPVSPNYLLKEMERFLRETFPKSITIEAEIPKDLWPISGDATQLHQVLMNLCLNAKDAMEKGGTLTLSARNFSCDEAYAKMYPEAKVGPYLVFSVKDTGCGIPAPDLEKIFDPFFTTKERGQGTGLGLSTVYSIVKGHGGFIRVFSEVGRETKFLVFLPASPSAEMAKIEEEKAPLPSGSGEFILVVEDEASLREIFQATLEAYGYQVISAQDGAEALALYAQHQGKIQAVISDLVMPIMDGPTTIRALQRINPAVKVIATSGMDTERMVAEGSGVAVKALLQKPFTAERLLRTLAEVLGER